MRKLKAIEYLSVDGVMEGPGPDDPYEHAGWTERYWDNELAEEQIRELLPGDALLLGRVTYQGFAAAWPSRPEEGEFGERMNSMPNYVASGTLLRVDWDNSQRIKEDLAEEVFKLKQESGQDILIYGSGLLVDRLAQHGLIDEYRLFVFPVVLGAGKRLFKDRTNATLRLVRAQPFKSGVVALVYEPAPKSESTDQG